MNNLFSAITSSVGLNAILGTRKKDLPFTIDDIKINLNDILSTNNFNFALSGLYENFLTIASKSYFYNPRFPVTNPQVSSTNNLVGTLCGAFVSYPGTDNYYKFNINGISHSLSAYNVLYDVHDFYVTDDYITLAIGILSSTDITSNYSSNRYIPSLLILNYSLSSIYSTTPYSSNFGNEGEQVNITPNFVLQSQDAFNNNIKFNKIDKIKFLDKKVYVLDSTQNLFVEIDTRDIVINRGITSSYIPEKRKLGFQRNSKSNTISTFCANKKYFAFYNYVKDSITIFSNSFVKLYDYNQKEVTTDGIRNSSLFADIEFDNNGDLHLLTKDGKIFIYTVTNADLTLKKRTSIPLHTVINTNSLSLSSYTEQFNEICFSKSDPNVFYITTDTNVYKKFLNKNLSIGQLNNSILNTSYYSTLSSVTDSFSTLFEAPTGTGYSKYSFLKYKIKNFNTLKIGTDELVTIGFTDNSTYSKINLGTSISNISGSDTFWNAQTALGINPVSGSGISLIVDRPNYVNLNNDDIRNIKIYDYQDLTVKKEEFVTDFTINKSLRKLLFNIFNFQTYLTYKPVIEIDVNNNPNYKKLEYILTHDKNQDFSTFDNFIGINEINSTIFLNRCFSEIYKLLQSVNVNASPDVLDIYPRYVDSVQITDNTENYVVLYEDSKQFVQGEFKKEKFPLNGNLCVPKPTPTPTSTPNPTATRRNNTSSPTPTPTATINVTPTPTLTPAASPTPLPTQNVRKTIKNRVQVALTNNESNPAPVAPFSSNTKTVSAVYAYDNSNYTSLVSPVSATFDHTSFNLDLLTVGGDWYKLVGRTYGDYTLTIYNSAYNTDYKIGGKE